jgi:hypothetical protein
LLANWSKVAGGVYITADLLWIWLVIYRRRG